MAVTGDSQVKQVSGNICTAIRLPVFTLGGTEGPDELDSPLNSRHYGGKRVGAMVLTQTNATSELKLQIALGNKAADGYMATKANA